MLIDFVAGTVSDIYNLSAIIKHVTDLEDEHFDIGYRLVFCGSANQFSNHGSSISSELVMPSVYLDVVDEDSAIATADCLIKYEQILNQDKPDVVLIYGQNNHVTGCTISAAKKQDVRIAHIGSGLRRNLRYSSDELNGRMIDAITDYHFPITQSSCEYLRNEGVSDDFVFFVGNPLADVLTNIKDEQPPIWDVIQLQQKRYCLLQIENNTLLESHSRLKTLILNIIRYSRNLPILLIISDKNRDAISATGVKSPALHLVDIHELHHMYYLIKNAKAVVTDTDKMQSESTFFLTPCMTLFKSVALPDTVETGTNEVIGLQADAINDAFNQLLNKNWKKGHIPYLWDGKVAKRIATTLKNLS